MFGDNPPLSIGPSRPKRSGRGLEPERLCASMAPIDTVAENPDWIRFRPQHIPSPIQNAVGPGRCIYYGATLQSGVRSGSGRMLLAPKSAYRGFCYVSTCAMLRRAAPARAPATVSGRKVRISTVGELSAYERADGADVPVART